MTLQDCIDFAKQYPVCYFATVEGDRPHVRAWNLWFADESGFYFHTFEPKDVCQQLRKNPNAELCFTNSEPIPGAKNLRVSGSVEFITDPALRALAFVEMPFLKQYGDDPTSPVFQYFRIPHGEAFFWTIANSMKERSIERIRF